MGYHAWRCGMSKYRSKSLGPRCSMRECQWRCSWTSKTAIQLAFAQDSIHQYAVYMLCKKWHQNKLKGKPKYTVPNTKGYTQRRSWSQIPKGSQCTNWIKLIQSFCAVKANRTHLISTLGIPFTLRVQPTGWFQHPCKILLRPGYLGIITPFPKKNMFETSNRFHWSISSFIPILLVHSSFTSRNYQQFANWKNTISKGKAPARKKH